MSPHHSIGKCSHLGLSKARVKCDGIDVNLVVLISEMLVQESIPLSGEIDNERKMPIAREEMIALQTILQKT